MKLTKAKLKEIIREELTKEGIGSTLSLLSAVWKLPKELEFVAVESELDQLDNFGKLLKNFQQRMDTALKSTTDPKRKDEIRKEGAKFLQRVQPLSVKLDREKSNKYFLKFLRDAKL